MERAARHSPLADLALALEEIDALSIAGLGRNHNTPVDPDLIALRAAVSRACVCLRKLEFWLVPATRASLRAVAAEDGECILPESGRRIIVAFRRSAPGEIDDPLRRPDGPYSSCE